MSKRKLLMKNIIFLFICALTFNISNVFASESAGQVTVCSHNYTSAGSDATCTDSGHLYEKCTKCGKTRNDSYPSALGHNLGSWYTDVAPTCMRVGQKKRDCSRCDYYETDVLPIDPNAHNWVWKNDGNGEPSNYSRTTQ